MLNICAAAAIAALIAFSALSLFVPYGLIAFAAIIPIGLACGVISRARGRECKLGFCGT
ncbi:hypothetical protein [Desulfococcus sp.]|uniref:hypothetical protein n=1 Tax=Desulfococcus sp. TaxID=2025834 RepID=UPI0035933FB5